MDEHVGRKRSLSGSWLKPIKEDFQMQNRIFLRSTRYTKNGRKIMEIWDKLINLLYGVKEEICVHEQQ